MSDTVIKVEGLYKKFAKSIKRSMFEISEERK